MLGKARAGIQPKVGPGTPWPSIPCYNGVMNQRGLKCGPTGATSTGDDIDGGGITLTGVPGYIFRIRCSGDRQDWENSKDISTTAISQAREFRIPVSLAAPRGFYKVERSSP